MWMNQGEPAGCAAGAKQDVHSTYDETRAGLEGSIFPGIGDAGDYLANSVGIRRGFCFSEVSGAGNGVPGRESNLQRR
jgi:hypothetical protein